LDTPSYTTTHTHTLFCEVGDTTTLCILNYKP